MKPAIVSLLLSLIGGMAPAKVDTKTYISEKTTAASKWLKSFTTYKIGGRITVAVGLQNYQMGNILSFLPDIERTGARTVRFEAKHILEAVRFVSFINYVRSNP